MSIETRTGLVVGDVGSTKGAWTGIPDNDGTVRILTDGYNPHAHRTQVLKTILDRLAENYGDIDKMVYYGTGISDDIVAADVANQIQTSIHVNTATVCSDLLGAARASLGNQPGVVAILGTGSNACIYDGTEVRSITPSLGYPLGDEGSGWRIGSTLIRSYFYGDMPADLKTHFATLLPDTRRELLGYLKQSPQPNRYLASFANFAGEFKGHPWISETIRNCLDAFVVSHLKPISPEGPVYFVGSIAHIFNHTLEELLKTYGLSIGGVLADPLEALIKYHTTYE